MLDWCANLSVKSFGARDESKEESKDEEETTSVHDE